MSTPCPEWSVSFPIFRPINVFENDKKQINKQARTQGKNSLFTCTSFLIHLRTQHPFFCESQRGLKRF